MRKSWPAEDEIQAAADETAGSKDTVTCGTGVDEVVANNNNDVVADNCENVTRVPNAQ